MGNKIHRENIEDVYPMSDIAMGMIYHSLKDPAASTYQKPKIYRFIDKAFDLELFKKAFALMVEKHSILRTGFKMFGFDEPIQIVYKEISPAIDYYDISPLSRPQQEAYVRDLLGRSKEVPFDFTDAEPLWRVKILSTGNGVFLLMWEGHHAMVDGWSTASLLTELNNTYVTLKTRPDFVPQKLECSYKDFVIRQIAARKNQEIIAFWKDQLVDYKRFEFPAKGPGEKAANHGTAAVKKKYEYRPGDPLWEQLKKAAVNYNTSTKNLCFAAYVYMLNMLSNDNDILVGLITNNRPQCRDGDKIIGCFLNTVPVRVKIPHGLKWKDFIQLVSGKLLQLKAYDMLSFFEITRVMGEEAREANPITDTIFSYVDFHVYRGIRVSEDGVTADAGPMGDNSDFSFNIDDSDDTNTLFDFTVDTTYGDFIVTVGYSTRILDEEGVKRWCGWYTAILRQMIREPEAPVLKHEIIGGEERQKLLNELNDTRREYPREKSLQRLYEEQAEKKPHHIAAVAPAQIKNRTYMTGMTYISYRELEERSNGLARVLNEKGVQTGTIVGIMVERGLEMLYGLLGILKAGGAYLPMDPGTPEERIKYILADSNAKILLTGQEITALSSPQALYLSEGHKFTNDQLAYIIYTSGSTGRPKGVMVEHGNVVRLVKNCNYIDFVPGDRLLLTGAIGFDITTFEIWYPLLNGLSLYQAHRETIMDAGKMRHFILRNKITLLHLIPQLFNQLADREPGIFAGLNNFLVGGDMVRPYFVNKIRKIYKNLNILHMYGPTENTAFSTFFPVEQEYEMLIPIGKPVGNSTVYILDRHGQLQPLGVAGEIWVGGDGTARGYLNNPGLTNKKFLRGGPGGAVFSKRVPPGRRRQEKKKWIYRSYKSDVLYRTGDLARWSAEDNIEFLGRVDNQVKIRGYRIELGEIENRLQSYKDVKEALAVLGEKGSGHKYILAYVVMDRGKKLNSDEIREYLLLALPEYMIPGYFEQLEHIPLTPRGKIDREALPEPGVKADRGEAYAPPGNEIEKQLVKTWTRLLARDHIGIHDNFFALGGDSIQAIQAAARMNEAGYKIEIRDILQGKTIAQLAPLVKKKERTADQSVITGTVPLTPVQKRFFQEVDPGNRRHFNQAVMLYSREGFTRETVEELFTQLVLHHDALRMVYKPDGETIRQENRGKEAKLFDLEVFNFGDMEDRIIEKEIQNKAGQIQGSMDLENGPLVKLGLFKARQGDHLLVVIHHLVVEGLSWRILFEDFSTGYRQRQQGKEIKFPDKTDSFKYWSGKLSEYAAGSAIRELQYWKTVESQAQKVHGLPGYGDRHLPKEKRTPHYIETIAVNLNQQETETLLRNVNHAYNTEINDILLTALGLAVTGWGGGEKVLIDLESHGREPIFAGIDITRTVGWFTAQYPVLLDMGPGEDLSYTIKSVKETLRRIPNKGTGYGILRYLTPDEKKGGYQFQCEPEISFNYLGQWEEENQGGLVRISGIHIGEDVSTGWEQSHALIINGMKAAGELKFVFSYNIHEYDKNSIKDLAAGFSSFLRRIIAHCSRKEESEFTPSDLGGHKISLDDFSRITKSMAGRIAGNPQIESLYPLSPMQSGMLYHALKNRDADAYFVQTIFQLEGQIEKSLLKNSLNKLLERYDILRTIFIYEDLEEPLQVVLKDRTAQVYYEDITHLNEDEKTLYIQEFKKKDEKRGFHLGKDILMRLSLFKTGLKTYNLVWSFHHILMDGWCLGIVYKELIEIYRLFKQEQPMELGAVTPYKTYIQWLEKQDKAAGLRYWQKYLEGCEQKTGLSLYVPKPGKNQWEQNEAYQSEEHDLIIHEELTLNLKAIAGNTQVTLSTMFQALWGVLLQKYNNCNDVVFGAVVSGRPSEIQGIEHMVGLFINTVPVRIKSPARQKISQLLKTLQGANNSTRSYEYLPLAEIQAHSALKINLFDHIMVFENYPIHEEVKKIDIKGETGTQNQYPTIDFNIKDMDIHEQTNYDFNIVVVPGSPFLVKFVYNGRVYENDLIMNIGLHLKEVLKQVADNPDTEIEKIEIITREEKKQVLFDFNPIEKVYPKDKTIHQLFEEQVKRTPDHMALIGENPKSEIRNPKHQAPFGQINASGEGEAPPANYVSITYRELNENSNQLARLVRENGVLAGNIVGITVERSIEMIIGILGILKAGCAYVPLNPKAPSSRNLFILQDCDIHLLLTTRLLSGGDSYTNEGKGEVKKIFLEDLSLSGVSSPFSLSSVFSVSSGAKKLAYVIFTSGSTGKPKGVPITHTNLSPLLHWGYHCLGLNSQDRILQNLAYYFDWSVWEIFITITSGACLFMVPDEILLNPDNCVDFMFKNKVTVLHVTPSQYQYLARVPRKSGSLKYLFIGAEKLTVDLVKRSFASINDDCRVFNMYGPTEATIISAVMEIYREDERKFASLSSIPIGQPIANTTLLVLDRHLNLCPINVIGELYIAGDGVARGYLNNPELTFEKFDHDLWDLQDYHDEEKKVTIKKYNKKFLRGGPGGAVFSKRVPPGRRRQKIYRTGDQVRCLADGNIEFLGRIDHQVKVRGHRIELGEIENRLVQHETVKEAVVTVHQGHSGDKYLCAYVLCEAFVKEDENTRIGKLKEYLSNQLPEYMIPSYFIKIRHIPLTPNGKIDRKALPDPEIVEKSHYEAPRDEIEKKLAAIWQEVLGEERSPIGIHDNFFELGGHLLKAMILVAKIHKVFHINLSVKEVFIRQTIKELSEYIVNAAKEQYAGIKPVEKKEYYALSSAQKRLYFLQQLDINSTSYNMPLFLPLGKEIERNRLEAVLKQLIDRHESLRTSFERVNEEPVQRIHDKVEFEIEYYDLYRTQVKVKVEEGEGTRGQPAAALISSFIRPFDLSRAPLLRSGLIKLADGSHTWMLDIHHIVSDGTSQGVLTEDFMSLDNGEDLASLRLQYKDFSHWQQRLFSRGVIKPQEKYWCQLYADSGEIPRLQLPTDYKRPEVFTFAGAVYRFMLDPEAALNFKKPGARVGATLYMNILAVLNTLFYKYTGQTDIILGTGVAGRPHADLQRIIGMFVNTLAMRNYPGGEKTYESFLKEVVSQSVKAFENQDVQFEELVDKLDLERDPSRNPLFDINMVVQNMVRPKQNSGIASLDREESTLGTQYETTTSKFDLTFFVNEQEENIYIDIEYYTGIFKQETIERMVLHLKRIIQTVGQNPLTRLKDIEIITREERRQVLYEFNDTTRSYPGDKLLQELYEEQAAKTPDRTAIIGAGTRLNATQTRKRTLHFTYRELNRKAGQLAYILKEKAVNAGKTEAVMAIMGERGVETIMGLLAILKAGGAYLPIDPAYPEKRIFYLLSHSRPKLLITAGGLYAERKMERWEEEKNLEIVLLGSSKPTPPFYPTNSPSAKLAYILYTSGSTGRPKAVMVEHRHVVRLVKNTNYIDFKGGDRILQTGALEFDASTFEIWGTLLNGLSLCLLEKEKILSAEKLKNSIKKYDITTLWLTSSLFNQVSTADIEVFARLKNLLVGGDVLTPYQINRVKRRHPGMNIINGYGPTENTTFSTTFLIDKEYDNRIPIGKPIANSTAYIVDKYGQLQPVYVAGELWAGGDGVARGYLNNPGLTAEKFVSFSNRSYMSYKSYILYKTGDLARWLPDGNIEFLGRIDHQVKIRGYRIEPGEIENHLGAHPRIKAAAVIARTGGDGDRCLCAYIVPAGPGPGTQVNHGETDIDIRELKRYLSGFFPGYLVPSYFVKMGALPLTANGKLDRKALPAPGFKTRKQGAAPGNEIQEKLVEIWSGVLNIDEHVIGIDDNFFELGGHSLKATTLVSRIHQALGVKLPLAIIFKIPFIRELAQYIEDSSLDKYSPIKPVEKKDYYVLSPGQKRLYFLQQMNLESTVYNMPQVIPLPAKPGVEKLRKTFAQLIRRHESLRTSFQIKAHQPVQRIHDEVEFEIKVEEIASNTVLAFDLSKAPLLRVVLEGKGDRYLLIVDMHHIITDGTSQDIFTKEFHAFYTGEELPEVRLQYKDYVQWRNHRDREKIIKSQESYWLELLSGELSVLNLPLDEKRPLVQNFKGNTLRFVLNKKQTRGLKKIARKAEATLYMTLLSIFTILLSKLSGQEDIILGTPVAGRRHAHLEHITGLFLNTLAMRNYPTAGKRFIHFLKEVKEQTLQAYENQEYPFEQVVDKLSLPRDTGRNPIFDVMFNMLNQSEHPGIIPGTNEESKEVWYEDEHREGTSKFDMSMRAVDLEDQLLIYLEYSTQLFKKETIRRITGYIKEIIETVILDPYREIANIRILSGDKIKEKLSHFNEELEDRSQTTALQHLLFDCLEKYRNRIAIESNEEAIRITYGELNRNAAYISNWLKGIQIKAGSFIGIFIRDREELIALIIGILKARCVFVPLDTIIPDRGIEKRIRAAEIELIFTDAGNQARLVNICNNSGEKIQTIVVDDSFYRENEELYSLENIVEYHGEDRVYIYFTSGSTGTPKAILGKNKGLLHFIRWEIETFKITAEFKFSQFTNPGFDVFLRDIFVPLCAGGTVVIPGDDIRMNRDQLVQWIDKSEIHLIHMVPSLFKVLISGNLSKDNFRSLRYILLAGEKINPRDLKRWYDIFAERIQLVNIYGPTETTLAKAYYFIKKVDIEKGRIPIGSPIRGSRMILLDKDVNICDRGIIGEIYIRTPYRSFGYYNDPALNRERFIPNPFIDVNDGTDLLYRTGDLGRELPDGNFEIIGRIDRQVKIRGIRIELGEIESLLLKHEGIREVVLQAKEAGDGSGEKYLCAYLVSDRESSVSELREYLLNDLPGYMVPSYFMFLHRFPMTPNGKIDPDALPLPERTTSDGYEAPRDKIEDKLVKIWSEVLGSSVPGIGINDNFFERGGHSLKATILVSRIHREFHVRIPVAEIFKTPVIKGIALKILNAGQSKFPEIEPVEKKEYYELSFNQKRLWIVHCLDPNNSSYHIPGWIALKEAVNIDALKKTLSRVVELHENFCTGFKKVNNQPVQFIRDHVDIPFQVMDISELAEDEKQQKTQEIISRTIRQPFDLETPPSSDHCLSNRRMKRLYLFTICIILFPMVGPMGY